METDLVGYRNIDLADERPSPEAYDAGWRRSRITQVEESDEGLSRLWYALTRTDVSASWARFTLDADPEVAWFLARRRLKETSFFEDFFNHAAVRDIDFLAGVDRSAPIDLGFEPEGCFLAMGRLAELLSGGFGLDRFPGSDAEVLALVDGFAEAAFGRRYTTTLAYVSKARWSPWFEGDDMNLSFLWIDVATGVVTVLAATSRY
jgi:hypothetical protein